MRRRVARLAAAARSHQGRIAGRYLVLTALNVVLGVSLLAFLFGVVRLSARDANLLAVAIGTGPSYALARRWVWQRRGRSHLLKEVLPFWVLSLASALLSTAAASWAEDLSRSLESRRGVQTVVVVGATAVTYGLIFVARFLAFNRLFRADDAAPHYDSAA